MKALNRIVSGMRPTGPLHLGHYFGVLDSWVELHQDHQCFFFVADWHALTTEYAEPQKIKGFVPDLVKDWVAAGLDPAKCVMFQQSQVKEHAELHLLLSMITPVSWLERNPTYKDVRDQLDGTKDLSTYGFLGYPVLMGSDILIYKPNRVPVGHDQLPHLELTREIARRANYLWGDTFPEPEAKLTQASKLQGLDGRKMSKSYGNAISLGENLDEVRKKVSTMLTCAKRMRLKDPGEPDECNLYPYHLLFTPAEQNVQIAKDCRTAAMGCGDCKKIMADNLIKFLEPFQVRRAEFDRNPDLAWDILRDGNEKAREAARATMDELRCKLNFNF
ncbi:tryptophan--tRNA ligase [Fundidesulfovibrio putealis]|uniref:tryptophan--tRNA ligase n=1 Tax=Fundidesulfovibrio putealis TaxID=270496 RepID=UPI00041CF30B|nr:tryptophan--tRNA ligase [Fundidesulfovibrio putealis]